MSNYFQLTKHPVTGEIERAEWIDDYFGRHKYGVRFPSDTPRVYEEQLCEQITPEMERIRDLEEQLAKALTSVEYYKGGLRAIVQAERYPDEPDGPYDRIYSTGQLALDILARKWPKEKATKGHSTKVLEELRQAYSFLRDPALATAIKEIERLRLLSGE